MKMQEVGLFDEMFTHIDEGPDRTQTTYNVTKLFAHVAEQPGAEIIVVPVDEAHARYCLDNRGVEPPRLKALMNHPEWLKKPVLFIAMPDESYLLVDGSHRYVVFWIAKAALIPAYIVPWAVARPFVVEDMPQTDEEALMDYSHIAELRKLRGGMQ